MSKHTEVVDEFVPAEELRREIEELIESIFYQRELTVEQENLWNAIVKKKEDVQMRHFIQSIEDGSISKEQVEGGEDA